MEYLMKIKILMDNGEVFHSKTNVFVLYNYELIDFFNECTNRATLEMSSKYAGKLSIKKISIKCEEIKNEG